MNGGTKMRVSNQIIVSPSEECYAAVLRYCRDNLVIPNPEYAKKSRMGFWIGDTPKTLQLYEVNGGNLILPYGTLRELLNLGVKAEIVNEFAESKEVDYNCSVPLYDYQTTAMEQTKKSYYGILQSKAGSGKTQIGIALISELKRRSLWLCTTKDLLKQSKERAEQYMSSDLIGTITEGKVNIGKGITFATIQTMCKIDLDRYKHLWDVIVVDECHRVSGTPTAITQFSKVLSSLSARHKFGLSATVHRSDGMIKATYALLGKVVYTVPDEAVAERVMKVGIKRCYTGTGLSRDCLNSDGTLNYTKLITYLCEDFDRNHFIGAQIVANSEHPSLILSDRLEHLKALMATLPLSMRGQAVMISGKMTSKSGKAEREKAIEDMRQGKKKYLFATYSLAKEGLDIPCLERLYLTTPQKDYAVVTQSIGRIARVCEGKQDPICYDFIDDAGYLVKAFKRRCSTYRKNGCYFVEETS